ncbi:hypothetical protein CDAR_446131 [Caerostris darwini]|uniref:Uncharacterized protein n=1 Tax=Caerostris darwini TaxID=1538125 RepID=A0AAV4SNN9_9ARAC|nr:hypothetical protein CDAR_446131 [Caerostris darwini]
MFFSVCINLSSSIPASKRAEFPALGAWNGNEVSCNRRGAERNSPQGCKFLITLHPWGELRSVPPLLHETSLPFQSPRAGNSALFEAGIDESRFMQAEKNIGSLKKNAYSVHERERRRRLKRFGKGNKKGGMSSQHQTIPLTLIGILWMICILDVRCFRSDR